MSQGTRHCLVSQGGYHTVIESEEKTLFSKSGGYIGMRQGLVSGNKIFFFHLQNCHLLGFINWFGKPTWGHCNNSNQSILNTESTCTSKLFALSIDWSVF